MTNTFASFKLLNLKPELLTNLHELDFKTMTPIQREALPFILTGEDILAQAKTGSGKTATFGLGILNSIQVKNLQLNSLILCPTRELAEQVAKEIRTLARLIKNLRVLTLCGGMSELEQKKSLSYGTHIAVGTPGRVLKLLSKKDLQVTQLKSFVLDEADKMLDMGFYADIMEIKKSLPLNVQTMLFSATFPDKIKELSNAVQTKAIDIKVDDIHDDNIIEEFFFQVIKHRDKFSTLLKILAIYRPIRMIIFCKTKQITDELSAALNKAGIYAGAIHGDLQQNERTNILTKFSNQSLSVLVATDVAARGIDIEGLEAVINYDFPFDSEVYTHRIGRTGRAGKTGQAFSLFVERERFRLDELEKKTNTKCSIIDATILQESHPYDLMPIMQTIYISGGKKDKLRPGDLLGALVNQANLEASEVGDIVIFNVFSLIAIKRESIEKAITRLNKGKIKNRKFKVGLA